MNLNWKRLHFTDNWENVPTISFRVLERLNQERAHNYIDRAAAVGHSRHARSRSESGLSSRMSGFSKQLQQAEGKLEHTEIRLQLKVWHGCVLFYNALMSQRRCYCSCDHSPAGRECGLRLWYFLLALQTYWVPLWVWAPLTTPASTAQIQA